MADRVFQVRFVGNTADLDNGISGVSSRFGVLAKGVAAAGAAVGAGLLGAGKALLDIGATFDSVSDTIRTQTGATGERLDGLVASAKNVGTEVPSSFEDVGAAVAGLNQRLGVSGPQVEDLAMQVLDLSRLTGTDLQANIEGVTRMFGDWGIKTEDQSNAMDKLFAASQATGAGIGQLQEGVVKFGAPLRQLGFSFEESLAILGKFEREGVNTDLVLGAMRKSLGAMAKAGEEPIGTFKRVAESIKNAGSTMEANKIAVELFGAKAGPDMAAAIREGRFAIDDLAKTISSGGGSIQAAADDTADFAEQWQILKNKAFVALEPVAARVFGMINEKMGQLAGWFDRNQAAVQGFVAGVGTAFGMLLTAVGTVAGAAVSLGLAIASVVSWIRDHWVIAMMVAIPILLLFGPYLTALGAAATINMAKVAVAWVTSTATAVGSAAAQSLAMLGTAAKFAFMGAQALIHGARVAAGWVLAMGPVGWVIAAVVGLVAVIVANWDTVKRWTLAAWSAVSGAVAAAWDWISRKTGEAKDWVLREIIELAHFFVTLPDRIKGALGNLGGLLVGVGSDIVNGLWRGIVNGWDRLTGQVASLAKRLFNAAKSALGISSPSKLFRDGIGRWIPEGMAAGINANAGSVRRAVENLGAISAGRVSELTPLSRASTTAASPAGSGGPRELALRVAAGADQAVATLIMQLIREGKIQLTA